MQVLAEHGMLDGGLRMRAMVLPERVFATTNCRPRLWPAPASTQGHRRQGVEIPARTPHSHMVETVKLG